MRKRWNYTQICQTMAVSKIQKRSGKINSQIAFERHDSMQNYHVECQQPLNIHQLSHGGEGGLLVIIS